MNNISVAMALISAVVFSQTTLASDNRLCLTNDTEFVASGYSVQDGIDDPNFDPSIEVQVTYSGKVCTSSPKEVDTLSVPVPNTPIEGDKRTIVQTRGGWVYTWQQLYTSSGWQTTLFSQRYIGNGNGKHEAQR